MAPHIGSLFFFIFYFFCFLDSSDCFISHGEMSTAHFIFTVVCCAEGSFSHSLKSEFLSFLIWICLTPLPDFGVLFSKNCEVYLKSWVSLTVRKHSLITVTSRWSNGNSLLKCCIVLAVGCLHPEILFFSQAHCGLFTLPLTAPSASSSISFSVCAAPVCSCFSVFF